MRINKLRDFFRGEDCKHQIYFNESDVRIGDSKIVIAGMEFQIPSFGTYSQKIRDSSEIAEAIDAYEFSMCEICRVLGRGHKEWEKYIHLRACAFNLILAFRATMIAFKNDPNGQKDNLDKIVKQMQNFSLLMVNQVRPNMEFLKSNDFDTKGDIAELDPTTLVAATNISGLTLEEIAGVVKSINS